MHKIGSKQCVKAKLQQLYKIYDTRNLPKDRPKRSMNLPCTPLTYPEVIERDF